MAGRLRKWLRPGGASERGKHAPVVCVLCGPTLRDSFSELRPCGHLYCAACWQDYSLTPQPLISASASSSAAPGIYCPTCLRLVEGVTKSSKLPERVRGLVAAVSKKGCRQHKRHDITATCEPCMEACCPDCLPHHTDDPHTHHLLHANTDAWHLHDLVNRVMEHETLAAQALRLKADQKKAYDNITQQIISDIKHKMENLRRQQADLLAQVQAKHNETLQKIEVLHTLASNTAEMTRKHICYLHQLLRDQPKRQDELLVNQAVLQARTQSLLLRTAPEGVYFTDQVCMRYATRFPKYQPEPQSPVGRLAERECMMPSVSQVHQTLEAIVGEGDPDTPVQNDPAPLTCYRIRERPEALKELYDPCSHNVEPSAAVFLPDNRLVVTERREHNIAIWTADFKRRDYDIPLPDQANPYAVTYCPKTNLIWYTDKRHFTIGCIQPTGENSHRLPKEILRNPEGIGVLNTGHIIVSDNNQMTDPRRPKGVKIVDPHTGTFVRTFHTDGSPSWISVLTDGRIAVTDKSRGGVYLYDGHGTGKVGEITLEDPEQLIEDAMGDLLVASAKSNNSAVMLYDGRELRRRREQGVLSLRNGGISSPAALALDNLGRLAVVQRTGIVKVYGLYDCG